MPRCSDYVPRSSSISRYLARRFVRRMRWPATCADRSRRTRQRSRGSCTATAMIRRPTACGSIPKRVVSTSGSSGICKKTKAPGTAGAFRNSTHRGQLGGCPARALLDLRLFVGDVLARDRIELAHFQLVGMQALVLGGHVEVAGSSRRQQLDFLAHGGSLTLSRRLQIFMPWARSSATTLSMPFFSIV